VLDDKNERAQARSDHQLKGIPKNDLMNQCRFASLDQKSIIFSLSLILAEMAGSRQKFGRTGCHPI